MLWLGKRLPFERHTLRNFFIHLLLCGPVALLHIWLLQLVNALMRAWSNSDQRQAPLWALLIGLGATNIMVYWGIVAVSQEIEFLEKYAEIHKTLMRDRLSVRLCVDPETLDAAVLGEL